MISEDYFFSQLERLYEAFERPLKKAKAEIAFAKMKSLLDKDEQVRKVFDKAIELESVPTIKQLIDVSKEVNPRKSIPASARRIVECPCGYSFVITWEILSMRTDPVRCPGQFYGVCRRTYHPAELELLFEQ